MNVDDKTAANGDPLVPRGAAFFPVSTPGPTRTHAFVLVPGFTLLAFASAVEPLRIANQLSQQPLYRWRVLSETGAAVASSSGIAVSVDGRLDALDRAMFLFVCSGNPPREAAAPAVVSAVQRHHRFGGTVGGICTGAVALARAGLLRDRRFTLHWENQPGFVEDFPQLSPSANRIETDGRVMTCGGGAASTDLMLSMVARDHGSDFAAMVSEMCLRTMDSGAGHEQRSSVAALMNSRNPLLIAVVNIMTGHIEDPLPIHDVARAVGCSSRHLERLFRDATAKTPGAFYRGLRLDRGRSLLSSTDMPLIEVATACGFASVSHFSKAFRAQFGAAPSKLKQTITLSSR